MNSGKKRVDDGVEILVTPGWQIDQPDSAIGWVWMPLPAVNNDVMATPG
jgi:hypothetical protein